MNKIMLVVCSAVISGCLFAADDNPVQNLISKITLNLSQHDYQNAKKVLNDFGEAQPELDYYVSTVAHSLDKQDKVTFTIKDMHLYLDDLIEAQKVINEGCKINSANTSETDQLAPPREKTLDELKQKAKDDDYVARCISKSGGHDADKIHAEARKILNRHQSSYFVQKSSFSGNKIGTIFGYFKIENCGDSTNAVLSATEHVFKCYLKDEEAKVYKRKHISDDLLAQTVSQKQKENAASAKVQQAKNDTNGTTVLNDYCISLRLIKINTEIVEHERKIAKEVGMVDKQKLYEAGETLVDAKKNAKRQEEEYRKQVGKKPNAAMCSATPYPL